MNGGNEEPQLENQHPRRLMEAYEGLARAIVNDTAAQCSPPNCCLHGAPRITPVSEPTDD